MAEIVEPKYTHSFTGRTFHEGEVLVPNSTYKACIFFCSEKQPVMAHVNSAFIKCSFVCNRPDVGRFETLIPSRN